LIADDISVFAGSPVIKNLIKNRGVGSVNKVLTCEAEAFPKPTVQWSVNGTDVSLNYLTHFILVSNMKRYSLVKLVKGFPTNAQNITEFIEYLPLLMTFWSRMMIMMMPLES